VGDSNTGNSNSTADNPVKISTLDNRQLTSSQPYQLTVKRGFLALAIMYACQLLASIAFAYGNKFIEGASDSGAAIDLKVIGVMSLLIGGAMVLFWVWTDIRRFGPSLLPQIGLQPSTVKISRAAVLVLLLLIATHLFAWTYRSVLLPLLDQGGIIGGGSQMFAHLRETGSVYGLAGFMVLGLFIGPVMEEVVFRGYLQSALARRLPKWGAITVTSLIFMAGHSPMILWPMYFMFSVAWGWIYMHTQSLKISIVIHMLSNLFYAVIAVMGWNILA